MHGLQEFDPVVLGKPRRFDFWIFVVCLVVWFVFCLVFWWRG
jgi:hypothetical protein